MSTGDNNETSSAQMLEAPPSVLGPQRHPIFYEEPWFLQVEGVLYALPPSQIDMPGFDYYISNLANAKLGVTGKSPDQPIPFPDITKSQLDAFLAVVYAQQIEEPLQLTTQQWSNALHLAKLWGSNAVWIHYIDHIGLDFARDDPIDYIEFALKCRVDHWLEPAYNALCIRDMPISAAEGERLGYRKLIAVCRIRELFHAAEAGDGSALMWIREARDELEIPLPDKSALGKKGKKKGG